ncbi:mono/diheme cytochrome c family protein [Oceanisphaera litoralis]|uniref:c-type cytochrome n=1 Tax=Oceanisphaera litoralis TaxID=225144 RepID=UPI001EF7C4F8|nr:c-type cytochrome [Oceanisphaera litoralis]MBM7457154.1 mono/diheme cytochrome c family protein [Oceanisphaera litoralis]
MRRPPLLFIVPLLALGLSGCDPSAKGFSLPPGDIAQGEQVFKDMQCLSCHTMEGYERPEGDWELSVALGGQVKSLKTYGELVTSVINPSHRLAKVTDMSTIQVDGKSVMPVYNNLMTVSELIDLVTFLESKYELEPYEPTVYDLHH